MKILNVVITLALLTVALGACAVPDQPQTSSGQIVPPNDAGSPAGDGPEDMVVEEVGGQQAPSGEDTPVSTGLPANDAPVANEEQPVLEIELSARQWEFEPSRIEVQEGQKVRLKITSEDATHGFALPQFGVNERLEPGKEVVVEFIADKAGEHSFFCNVFCGSGHGGMKGTLIVS